MTAAIDYVEQKFRQLKDQLISLFSLQFNIPIILYISENNEEWNLFLHRNF